MNDRTQQDLREAASQSLDVEDDSDDPTSVKYSWPDGTPDEQLARFFQGR